MDQKQEVKDFPFYIKATTILLGLVLFTYILSALADVLVPFAFSILIAILLNPLYTRLEKKLPKTPAIILTILLAILVVISLFYFFSTQISVFINSVPLLKQKA